MTMFEEITTHIYSSPIGNLLLGCYGDKLCLCDWYDATHRHLVDHRIQRYLHASYRNGWSDTLDEAVEQLDRFFTDSSASLKMPMLLAGTPFQIRVWEEIERIPYGEKVSYKMLATRIFGFETKVRAVAGAVASNAISVFIPCHRVVGIFSPGGYSGGEFAKRYLLDRESHDACVSR